MKNKKIIIIILIIILIIVTILGIVINKKNKSLKKSQDDKNNNKVTVNLSSVYEKEDITELDLEKTKDIKIAEKYNVGSNIYKLNANVDFNGMNGEMIFLREDNNKANIRIFMCSILQLLRTILSDKHPLCKHIKNNLHFLFTGNILISQQKPEDNYGKR